LDFERRRVSVLVNGPEGTLVVTKGAPEGVLPCCTSAESGGADVPFTAELQAVARRTYADLSRAGFHVLAIARKSASAVSGRDRPVGHFR